MRRAFAEGVRLQARNLRDALPAVRDALAAADLGPARAGTLILSGIGASWHALGPATHALQAAGRRAYAVPPSALTGGLGDAFVLVSQSGASAELVDALERVGDVPAIAISADGDSPLARAATTWLPLGPERDTAVSTLGFTATLLTLGLLTDALLGRTRDWDELPGRVDETLARFEPPDFAGVTMLDAIGGAAAAGSAGETALLAREALLLPAAAHDTRSYLHGPLESVSPGYGAVLFGGARERRLAAQLADYGARTLLIEEPDPILQILPVQLLVQHLAGREIRSLAREQDDTKVPVG